MLDKDHQIRQEVFSLRESGRQLHVTQRKRNCHRSALHIGFNSHRTGHNINLFVCCYFSDNPLNSGPVFDLFAQGLVLNWHNMEKQVFCESIQ
ncbi:hypothetical protein D3C86_2086470 [compost metagenome]